MGVEGATHKQVVDLIKSGGDSLTLTVISVSRQVGRHVAGAGVKGRGCVLLVSVTFRINPESKNTTA